MCNKDNMRNLILHLSICLTFTSCFIGADTYEKSVNDFFFLYSDTYKTDNVCLGIIDYEDYRIGNSYTCSIKRIGWDKSFLIIENHNSNFFIQDLRKLEKNNADSFQKYFYGPMTKSKFYEKCKELKVDKNLKFKINY